MTKDELNTIAEKINKKFNEERLYAYASPSFDETIYFDINWGDWKHEHLRADWLVGELLSTLGYQFNITTNVTEEDGSDTYSAEHIIRFEEA